LNKRYIEYDLPLKDISNYSAIEKNNRFGHPSTLHIWWARKPLSASRATIFASLVDLPVDPVEREQINDIIKKIALWEAVNKRDIQCITWIAHHSSRANSISSLLQVRSPRFSQFLPKPSSYNNWSGDSCDPYNS